MGKALSKEQWRDRVVGFDRRPAKDFQANALNFRRHPNAQRDAFRGLVSEVGFAGAVLENKRTGNLIDGHLRIEEALSVDENMSIPVIQIDVSESEEKLLLASFDPISAMAVADKEILDSLLREVSTGDAAVSQMLSELAEGNGLYFGEKKEDDESEVSGLIDRAAELQQKWQVKRGNLYAIGSHRLLCGDSTDVGDVSRLMGGERADCGFSDPPYGIKYKSGTWSDERRATLSELENDSLQGVAFTNFLAAFYNNQRMVTDGDIYICCEWKSYPSFHAALVPLDKLSNVIVWNKRFQTQALNTFAFAHEFILFFGDNGGPYRDINVWTHDREFSDYHSTPKPVALVEKALKYSCKQRVTDFFVGGGSTMVAAGNLSLSCYGIEIEPKYCAVTLERMSLLGLTPELIDG